MAEHTTSENARLHPSDEMIHPARLHHVTLQTARFKEMRDYYTHLIGIHPNAEFESMGWYTYDFANHRMALVQMPFVTAPMPTSSRMHHMAFEYDSIDDLMQTYLRLKKLDIVPATVLNHGMTTSFYYQDPDGNYIELQVDNWDAEAKGSTAFMKTSAFLSNPIGVPMNPDSYVEAWKKGATVQELHQRGWAGEFLEGAPPVFGGMIPPPPSNR